MIYWIIHRKKQNIPKQLFYENCQTHKTIYGQTPLMEWIIHRCGEPIPDELYYPGWQTDRDNDKKTPLM